MNKLNRLLIKVISFISILLTICFWVGCSYIFCDHIESDWIIDTKATLENKGEKHTECTKCGIIIQTQKIPELEYSLSEVKQIISKSMVKVYCYDYDKKTLLSQGSGFFINKTGTFITNAHVVEDTYYIKIKTYLGTSYDVNVMYVYNYIGSDYAICKAQNCFSSTPVEFEEETSVGDTVYAFGYPNDAFILSSTQGVVTATNVVDKGVTYIENTAKIDHGSSGGILANSKGKVVGITTGILENNKYAALTYSEIKEDVTKNHYGIKEPLEWFHTKKEISLNSFNFDTYFDISITPTSLYGGNVRYNVSISLKPQYRYKKVDIKYTNLYFSVRIDTNYKYYSTLTYGGGWKNSSSLCYAYVYMYDKNDMHWQSSTATSSFFYTNYSNLYYDYDYDISAVIGTIVIYD